MLLSGELTKEKIKGYATAIVRIERLFSKNYEGHLESKERFAIQRYLLIIGKKKNMQVL